MTKVKHSIKEVFNTEKEMLLAVELEVRNKIMEDHHTATSKKIEELVFNELYGGLLQCERCIKYYFRYSEDQDGGDYTICDNCH